MIKVGVCSLAPAAGGKTLMANLTYELGSRSVPCLAIDRDSSNLMRLHFGMPLNDPRGHRHDTACELFDYSGCVHFLPYGTCHIEQIRPTEALADLDVSPRQGGTNYRWQLDNLGLLEPASLQTLASDYTQLLCVVEPAPLSYAYLYKLLQQHPNLPQSFRFVLNKVAPHKSLNKDIMQLLRSELNPALIAPMFIHEDQHVPEALATQQPLADYAVDARARGDIEALALWLRSQHA